MLPDKVIPHQRVRHFWPSVKQRAPSPFYFTLTSFATRTVSLSSDGETKGVRMNTQAAKTVINSIIILGISISLAGCNVGWMKPGATRAEFNQDRYDCQIEAAKTYPVSMVQRTVSTGYQTPAQTQCNNAGYGNFNCTTTGGNYVPPSTITEDVNMNNRSAAFHSCMQAKGYEYKMEFKSQSSSETVTVPEAPKTDFEIADDRFKQKDYAGAFAIYKRLADAGSFDAAVQVGNMYFSGQGVQKDYAQAFYWYKKPAENGNKIAQKKIAIMYELGLGVDKNQHEADVWYQRAGK